MLTIELLTLTGKIRLIKGLSFIGVPSKRNERRKGLFDPTVVLAEAGLPSAECHEEFSFFPRPFILGIQSTKCGAPDSIRAMWK
jgi:hypothetical protein